MEQLTAGQIAEWEMYDTIDPIGDFRIEMTLAQGLSFISNLLIKAHFKSGSKLTEPVDFLVDWTGEIEEDKKKKQSAEDMKSFLTQFAKEQNRRVEEKERKKQKR